MLIFRMKKLLPYILIIVLAGVFIPFLAAQAGNAPLGNCVLKATLDGTLATLPGETESHCHELATDPKQAATFVSWTEETGNCVVTISTPPSTTTIPSLTKTECDKLTDPSTHTTTSWKSDASSAYHLLAPLPGVPSDFDPAAAGGGGIGKYLNVMIKFFIGICAVLAVIMIVVGGIEYMASELPGNKEAGKDRIQHAIWGLVLALSAWTLLYTINPDILNTDLSSLTDQQVTVAMDETETLSSALSSDDSISGSPAPLCPEGIVKTASGIPACKRIAANFDKMIVAAKAAGKNISGSGYRSVERQAQLRVANCKGDIKTRPGDCHPPTALPGASNHNNGLAFDLSCDGQKIATGDNKCFLWLSTNAGSYGLRNLASEPWHWSVDGR
jgi:type IV secretory pathway VirB2 component (pilin)